jgi:hypothetical protein
MALGSTFIGHDNLIRASSDVSGATVRGAVVANGGTIKRRCWLLKCCQMIKARLILLYLTADSYSYPIMSGISILSLDGGGVRDLSSLLILRKIMAQLRLKALLEYL